MELQDACVSAQREIGGIHAELSEMIKRLDQLAAKGEGREEVGPEIRGLHTAVEDLDRKMSDLERQLPASRRTPSEEMPWYEWI
jgi:predicted RNase H-like nuclease (RuvC/YqgF family)